MTPVTPMNRSAAIVQRLMECRAVGKRIDPTNQRWEYLVQWTGVNGEPHEAWYPDTRVILGD